MLTYQDLLAVGDSDEARGKFCRSAVNIFMASPEYKAAKDGEAYYHKHNQTIEKYVKLIRTVTGRQVQDIFSANYKLKTLFFRRLVIQQVQYVLGNGMVLSNAGNKEKLGKDFDFKLQNAAKKGMAEGRAFGFWNNDHIEIFGFADTDKQTGFCPLYNEDTSELDAGIRYFFKKAGNETIFRCTLFEADGYTDFVQKGSDDPTVENAKRAYKQIITRTAAGDIEEIVGENYSALPIVPLYVNDSHESELVGIRESIDCYDFIKSGLANDIDDTSGFYWILKNTGGMDDADLAEFVQRMKTVKATVIDGDQGVDAEAHTLSIPTEARSKLLEILRADIYEDFQALDVKSLSAAQKTTQEIQSAYQAQDDKCADFEYLIIDFCQKILELAGIDDNPSFVWNKVVNMQEITDMIISCANYIGVEMVIKKLPFLTPEEQEQIIKDIRSAQYKEFHNDDEDEAIEGEGDEEGE